LKVEELRKNLALILDFNLNDAWCMLDPKGHFNESVNTSILQSFLHAQGIYKSNSEIDILIKKYERG